MAEKSGIERREDCEGETQKQEILKVDVKNEFEEALISDNADFNISDIPLENIVLLKEEPLESPMFEETESEEKDTIPEVFETPKPTKEKRTSSKLVKVKKVPKLAKKKKVPKLEDKKEDKESELEKEETENLLKEYLKMTCEMSDCDYHFKCYSDMKVHYSKVHNIRGYLTCCNKKFMKKHFIVDHLKYHKNPEEFKCKVCLK